MTDSRNNLADVIDIQADVQQLEKNISLYEPLNFTARTNAIDFIEFHVLDRIDLLLPCDEYGDRLATLQDRANHLISRFNEVDTGLFTSIREDIINEKLRGPAFKRLIAQYVNVDKPFNDDEGYNDLDIFINGLFPDFIPQQTKELESEMVFYQKTPVRVIFEIAGKVIFTDDDVFYDLGSGLGQVGILLNLLMGVTAKGIEYEPAFSDYATSCARDLNLTNVHFLNADVRHADLSDGTIFFMYTPFTDGMLQDVLEKLRVLSGSKPIKIITYGPCSAQVAKQKWLKQIGAAGIEIHKPAFFIS